jgi:outer membrane protein OmpA-like peptidoglycan-associated protein
MVAQTDERGADMRRVIVAFLLTIPLLPLPAELFRFHYEEGQKYRLLTEVSEDVYYNGLLSHRADILNKIAVDTQAVRGGAGLLSCSFLTSERAYGTRTSFSLTQEYQSMFWRDALGHYDIGSQYFMPVVRHVPVFPEGDIDPGFSWSAPGEEAHDLRNSFGIAAPVHFPIDVRYTYRGPVQHNGKTLQAIDIEYEVFHRLDGLRSGRGLVPVRITGASEQTYYWDPQRGQPDSYEESFDFIFYLSDGQYVEYVGTAEGRMLESTELDREKVAAEISEELRQRGVEDTTVAAEQQGVTLTLQNIQFAPNSARLLPSERDKLRAIGEILKGYPDRDILITGHTARVPGYTAEDHQLLSEQRAAAVADYLLGIGALRENQVTTKGMGYREPVGDNSVEAGRSQNRRVEITILEN